MYVITAEQSGKKYDDTPDGRARLDADEGRVRMNNAALEALVVLDAGNEVSKKCAERLRSFCRETGTGRMLRAHLMAVDKIVRDMMLHVSVSQVITLQHNTRKTTVTVSSAKVGCCVNMEIDQLTALAAQALTTCGTTCTRTLGESRRCPVRRALEQIPTQAVPCGDGKNECPYASAWLDV